MVSKPLYNHIHYKIERFVWLETEKNDLRKDLSKFWKISKQRNRVAEIETEQEEIYSNLKRCKNLAKYHTYSSNKMKSIENWTLLEKLDFDNIEEVEKRLNHWYEQESKKINNASHAYPSRLSEKNKKKINKNALALWKYFKNHGVYPKKHQSSSTNLDNVY